MYENQRSSFPWFKLLIAAAIAGFSLFSYFSHTEVNPVTEKKQHLTLTPDEEIALGVQSAPSMEAQYGGESNDAQEVRRVKSIGSRLVSGSVAHTTPYKFDFHVLSDDKTINAFALPGGQVFITNALLHKLKTDGQLAGVLGHEVGHVVARHSAEQLAKQRLTQGLTGAAAIAAYDPNDPNSRNTAMVAAMIGSLVNMRFGRQDELEADKLGVRIMSDAGYDPHSMVDVMDVLKRSSPHSTPEFFSTHPNPENRTEKINAAIAEKFPDGVPSNLQK